MVTFATPPREPNAWFTEVEPAPLSSLPAPAITLPVARERRRLAWPVSAVLLLVTAMGMVAQMPTQLPVPTDSFARNRLDAQALRLLKEELPAVPRLTDVRALMNDARLFCQPTVGRGADSLLTCLGHAVRYQQAYSRMAFRFVSHGDSVTQVIACPALVVHHDTPAPERLARAAGTLAAPGCWKDPNNPLDADWAYTSLPDSVRFTLVPVPDAPRMRVESTPSTDTITVMW